MVDKPGFIASSTSNLFDNRLKFFYIDDNLLTTLTDIIDKNVTKKIQIKIKYEI